MKRVSQLLMAAGLFAFGAYNVLVFQEIRVISRFCGNQYKETQESPPTFESVVMFAHDIAKNNQIHPPLFTSFTRLGKHFRSKSHANCGDVSQLAAEIGDELNLDIREVQILVNRPSTLSFFTNPTQELHLLTHFWVTYTPTKFHQIVSCTTFSPFGKNV